MGRVCACICSMLLAGLAGCAKKASVAPGATGTGAANGKRGATGVVPVVVATVQKKDMPLAQGSIGAVESMRSIAVKSFVTGTLMKVNFQEGQEVKKGDLLFELDPRPFENALHLAEADRQKTLALLENADTQVERYAALVEGGMVSQEQFQNIQNTAHTLRATLAGNEAAIANAKLQLDYCSIHAPCDGRTGALGAHEGDLVRASDANVALVVVTQLAPIYVTFTLPQQNLAALQHYQANAPIVVVAQTSGVGAAAEKGTLTFLDSLVDASSGTIKLKATFVNTKHTLWPGQFVRVDLTLATLPDQIVIPTPAVQIGQRGQQVYVVRPDNTVELRPITVDRTEGPDSVIAKGLAAGESVVVDGQMRLRPNIAVAIKPPVEDIPAVRPSKGARKAAAAGGEGTKEKSGDATATGPKPAAGAKVAQPVAEGS